MAAKTKAKAKVKQVVVAKTVDSKMSFMDKFMPKISSVEVANTTIRQTGVLYLALGVIMVAFSLIVSPLALFDAAILFLLSGFLLKLKAKWVAGVMVGYASLSFIGTLLSRVGGMQPGLINIVLSGFVLFMSVRAWQSVGFLSNHKK